jgi:hypothetical protein
VEGEVRDRAIRALDALRRRGDRVSAWNRYVVVLGKCLECYSFRFPEVFDRDGLAVSVEAAIVRMGKLAEGMLGGQVPGEGVRIGPGVLRADRMARTGGGR